MRNTAIRLAPRLLAGGALALGACGADRPALEPAPEATRVPALEDTVFAEVDGIRVWVRADEWPGPLPIRREVTPVRVAIVNGSDRPVRLQYRDFALVGPAGRRWAALPPPAIEGDVDVRRPADGVPPIERPGFAYEGFEVAPYFEPMYPGITVYDEPFALDSTYYGAYTPYWAEIELPTREMLELALPEGVIRPGGRVDGFLYFEHVDPEQVERVVFRADLVDPRTGVEIGDVEIPFDVYEAGELEEEEEDY